MSAFIFHVMQVLTYITKQEIITPFVQDDWMFEMTGNFQFTIEALDFSCFVK